MDRNTYLDPYTSHQDELKGWTTFFDQLIDEYKDWKTRPEDDFLNDEDLMAADRERLCTVFEYVQARSSISEYAGASYRLKCILELTDFELFTMMLCAATQFNANYEFVAAEISRIPDRRLDLATCEQIYRYFAPFFGNERQDLTVPERDLSRLFFYPPERYSEAVPPYARPLSLNPKLLLYLMGDHVLSSALTPYARLERPAFVEEGARIHQRQCKQLDALLGVKDGEFAIHLKGPDGVGKHYLLKKMAYKHGLTILYVDFQALCRENESKRLDILKQIRLEALLEGAKICVENVFLPAEQLRIFAEREKVYLLLRQMQEQFGTFLLLGSGDLLPDHSNPFAIYLLELFAPTLEERRELWEFFLADYEVAEELDPMRLAAKFNCCAADVQKVSRLANLHCQAAGEEEVTGEHILSAIRSLNINLLSSKAQYIRPVFTFDDMVLEESQMQTLRDFCNRVLNRYALMVEMGYGKKFPYGQSSALLLYGPPGTGKTMAAQAVAGELGMDLYKINLSQVFSKYIGETEKQLEEIFESAKQGNAVLFFDEADALFSKRTEVSDAHDKYANVETSYLLQKLEEFDGILILATNNAGNMDPAFRRRMTASVGVQLPDEAQRLELWKKSFTPKTRLAANIDWNGLAQRFELPPSCIKQAALTASYLAAKDGCEVGRAHIMQAVRQEFAKLGKMLFSENL